MSKRPGKPYDPPSSFVQKITNRMTPYIPKRIASWLRAANTRDALNGATGEQQQQQPILQLPQVMADSDQTSSGSSLTVQIPAKRLKTDLNVPMTQPQQAPPYPCNINYLMDDASSSNSEMTSGCSSRVPLDNQLVEENEMNVQASSSGSQLYGLLFDPNSMKPGVEMSKVTPQPPARNQGLGFDVTVARTPVFSRDRQIDKTRSPFYNGKTCYGGANAYRRSFSSNRLLNSSRSSSANNSNSSLQGSFRTRESSMTPEVQPYLKSITERMGRVVDSVTPREDTPRSLKRRLPDTDTPKSNGPPIRSLNAPTVRDMMQGKVNLARSLTLPKSKPAWKESAAFTFRKDESLSTKHSNKVRRNEEVNEMPEPLRLPEVALQITNMPTFDFAPPPKVDSGLATFTFSEPIDAKSTPKATPIFPQMNFTPSTPVARKAPEKKPEPPTLSGFGDIFKKQPTPESKKTEPKALPTQGFGNLFKKVEGMWECEFCLVSNQPKLEKCVACQNSRKKAPEAPKKVEEKPLSSWGNMFKKPEGNWECSSCMVSNKKDDTKCVSCSTDKPGAPKPEPPKITTPLVSSGFGAAFKKPPGSWDCPDCCLNNKPENTKCACCEKPRHTTTPATTSFTIPATSSFNAPATSSLTTPAAPMFSTRALTPSVNGFGDKFKKPANKWSCPVCLVNNDEDQGKCVACQTDNPSGFKIKPVASSPEKPKFSFGVIASPPEAAKKDLFSFGAPPKEPGVAPTLGFVFGEAAASKVEQKSFSFGVAATPAATPPPLEQKKEEVAVLPPPAMMFAAPASTGPRLKRKAGAEDAPSPPKLFQAPSFLFSAPKPDEPKNPSFNFLTEEDEEKPKAATAAVQSLFGQAAPAAPAATFSFAPQAKEPEKATPAKVDAPATSGFFQFGAPAGGFSAVKFDMSVAKPAPKEATPVFGGFGAVAAPKASTPAFKPPETMGGFAFAGGAAPLATPAAPSFSFGAPAAKPAGPGFGEAPPPSLFGAAPTPGGLNVNAPAFSMGKPAMGGFNFSASVNSPSVLQPIQQANSNAPVGGYNFNSSNVVPQFNPDLKPTFNFTGNTSVTAFNATSATSSNPSPAMQARKIRKATRRIPQQPR